MSAGCFCPGLPGTTCGRIIDCGEVDGLCDICQSDKAALAKLTSQNQEVVIEAGRRSYLVLDGNEVVRQVVCITAEAAYHQLKLLPNERLALVIDCTRPEWDKKVEPNAC